MSSSPPRLGLVCITSGEQVRFKTITRKRLLAMPPPLQQKALRELYSDNVRRISAALQFCRANGIQLYRLSSGLFPSSEESPGAELLQDLAPALARTGQEATRLGIRLVMHPDQFVVLSSDDPNVIAMSVRILENHARLLDLLHQPRSPWAAIEIHGGKGGRSDRLVQSIRKLPESVRSRIVLENDESAYDAREILEVCRKAGVPMVFDAHHHVCHEALASYDDPGVAEFTELARTTWPDPEWQMVHISNGRTRFDDPAHSDYIEALPAAFRDVPWIEVEAKMKELAIARMRRLVA
jgi:UV DNA damage endonuclease